MPKLRAPTANGEVLAAPDFAAVPALVAENRRRLDRDDVSIGGLPLREFRAQAKREVLELATGGRERSTDAPLILAGHQPELSHPGVWAKNFALAGLAKKLGGTGLNLIVDNDTLKSTSLPFPVIEGHGPKVRIESVAFDSFAGEVPYEDRKVEDDLRECVFDSFADRAEELWQNWGYEPLLGAAWPVAVHEAGFSATISERFTAMRKSRECVWGCCNRELAVSRLSQTQAFFAFASHVLADLPRFRAVYNAAIRAYREVNDVHSANHPAPELAEGEAPFWVRTAGGRRERATAASDVKQLRPRALTLTLFTRMCLGDFFIHGIGGGKYDEVTDDIIRNYFGVEPPAYQVLSATLHLPLPAFPATAADLKRAERHSRDLHWSPDRYLTPENLARPEVRALVERKAALTREEPPYSEHAKRKVWFRELQAVKAELRHYVWKQATIAKGRLPRIRVEAASNAVLQRRDYPWVLYPEATLRPFLQQFLSV